MREKLENTAVSALSEFTPPAGKVISSRFKALFASKMGALFDESESGSDSDSGGMQEVNQPLLEDTSRAESPSTSNLLAYLYHASKLTGIKEFTDDKQTERDDALLKLLSENVLRRIMREIPLAEANPVQTDESGSDGSESESAQLLIEHEQKKQKEQDEKIISMIDSAISDEFASMGAVQTITKYYKSNQQKKFDLSYIIENFILGGRTLITDVPDNLVMTPVGRITKALYFYFFAASATATAAYTAINYIFFGAMFFYVLQLPLLYFYRMYKYGRKDKRTTLHKDEIIFGLLGCTITLLVSLATFITLFWPFVIGIFSVAVFAHSLNLYLTVTGRTEARKKYENSLNEIQELKKQIAVQKEKRARLYAEFEKKPLANIKDEKKRARKEIKRKQLIEKRNRKICNLTRELDRKIDLHNDIRKAHEIANNRAKMTIAVVAVIVAALVLIFFTCTIPFFPPAIVLPALGVMALLGCIGALLVVLKTRNKYKNERKSEREHAVEVSIAEDLTKQNDLGEQAQNKQEAANEESSTKEKGELPISSDTELNADALEREKENKVRVIKPKTVEPVMEEISDTENSRSNAGSHGSIGIITFKVHGRTNPPAQKTREPVNQFAALSKTSLGLFSGKSRQGFAEKNTFNQKSATRERGGRLAELVEKRRRFNDDVVTKADKIEQQVSSSALRV